MKAGAELIAEERARQINEEGFTPSDDARYTKSELLAAAACYFSTAQGLAVGEPLSSEPPRGWPWDASWWKPTADLVRMLTKAGALFQAEADRVGGSCRQVEVCARAIDLLLKTEH